MCGQPTGLLSISLLDHVTNSLSEEDLITALCFIYVPKNPMPLKGRLYNIWKNRLASTINHLPGRMAEFEKTAAAKIPVDDQWIELHQFK